MKYFNLSILFFVLFCFTACQENQDLTAIEKEDSPSELVATTDLAFEGRVVEINSVLHWTNENFLLHNVSVQLMFLGEVLYETNTDQTGLYNIPMMPVPDEGAYLLFESPDFYPNVIKVDTLSSSTYGTNLIRKNSPNINGEAISSGGPYIKLKGTLQDPTDAAIPTYYITNSQDELIGTAIPLDDFTDFTITTVADEELFLHYKVECIPEGVIPLGSFSEDTDLGVLLDQSFDFTRTVAGGFFSEVLDCSGSTLSEYMIFFKANGLTTHSWGTAGFGAWECDFLAHPVTVTIASQNPRRYQEKIINYTPGQNLFFPMRTCTDDDTFIKYTIGNGAEVNPDFFTYANVLSSGELLLKQKDPDYDNGTDITFVVGDAAMGSNTSDVVFYSGINTRLGAEDITTTITMNDGEFVEGTFSGEAFDGFEVSLGILEGSFRARIQ